MDPSHFSKKKIIRFYLISYVLLAFAIFAIGSSLTASYLQKRDQMQIAQILQSEDTSSLDIFFYKMPQSKKKTLLIAGVVSAMLAGFCFTAAYKEQKRS